MRRSKGGGRLRFALEPCQRGLFPVGPASERVRPDQLDRGAPGEQPMSSAPHFAHAAASEERFELVAAERPRLLLRLPDGVAEQEAQDRRGEHEHVVADEHDQRIRGQPLGACGGRHGGAGAHHRRERQANPDERRQGLSPRHGFERGPDERDDGDAVHVGAANAAEVDGHQRDDHGRRAIGQAVPEEEPVEI